MKRLWGGCIVFALGLVGGAAVRFNQHWQHGYRSGYSSAVLTMRCEAVREGHGRWELDGSGVGFQWNKVHTHYRPDHIEPIPGVE